MAARDSYTSPLSERYPSKEMKYLFSQDMKFKTWRRLWIALAETEKELGLDITQEQFDKLYHACRMHTHERATDDATINTCYDADRLDLGRVGIPLDPEKMATTSGKKLARAARAQNVSVYQMREWLKKQGSV